MRSRIRIIASGIIILAIIFSYYSWNAVETPTSLPAATALPKGSDTIFQESFKTKLAELPQAVQDFMHRTILSYDESVAFNNKTCPTEGVNFDEGTVKKREREWRYIASSKISDWRQDIAEHLYNKQKENQEKKASESSLTEGGEEQEAMGGRGIVMAAGDHAAVVRARTNIRLLRSYNCALPVEIFHFPDELSTPEQSLLEELSSLEQRSEEQPVGHSGMNVTIRVVDGVQKGDEWKGKNSNKIRM